MTKTFFSKFFTTILITMLALAVLPTQTTQARPPMAGGLPTRFYLQNAAAAVTPTTQGAWDATGSVVNLAMARTKSGAITTVAVAEAVNNATYDVLMMKFVSEPIPAQTIAAGSTLNWIIGSQESSNQANMFYHVHAYVVSNDGTIVRGTLLTDNIDTSEWSNTAVGDAPAGAKSLSAVTAQANDRIVIEIGYRSNSDATSRTGTLWYGGTNASDLTTGGATNDETTYTGWFEFSQDLFPLNSTTAGTATATATGPTTINVSMPYVDDGNANSTYTVQYCLTSANCPVSGLWNSWVTGAAHTTSPYTTTIFGLTPGTSYDVRVTYIDTVDGVTGSNPQTITGVTPAVPSCSGSYSTTAPAGNNRVVVVVASTESGNTISGVQVNGVAATTISIVESGNAQIYTGYYPIGSSASPELISVTTGNGGGNPATCTFATTYTNINQNVGNGPTSTINSIATAANTAPGNTITTTTTNTNVLNAAAGAVTNVAGGRVVYAINMNGGTADGQIDLGTSTGWTFSEVMDKYNTDGGNRTSVGESTTTTAGSATVTVTTATAHNRSAMVAFALNPATTPPTITSATYDASTGALVVTGTDLIANAGVNNDIDASMFTLTGEGGSTYSLTDTADVEITSATQFTLTLSATDRAAVNQILNKNGTTSTGGTIYNLAGADDWDAGVTTGNTSDASNAVTVSNVAVPTLTSATYNASTGILVVTGTGFLKFAGATNDISVSKLAITGESNTTYTLTTADVEITSSTSFTVNLNATDIAALNQILNRNGTSSTGGIIYNLAGAEDWNRGADAAVVTADPTGNGITVSGVVAPTITSATYNTATGVLVVTGTGLLNLDGATNDIDISKLTITGEGGGTYTLTTPGVEITNGTTFSVTLNATDRAAVNLLLNKNGASSTGGTTYNLAGAEDWNRGADAAVVIADTTGNGITVSNVAIPAITSATYNASTGVLVVTGTGLLPISGATNDIVANKFTFTGQAAGTYTLTTTPNVEITSSTSFTLTLSGVDRTAVNLLLNKNGTSAIDATTYNLAAAEDWDAGADAAVVIADLTGNGITVSGVNAAPTGGNETVSTNEDTQKVFAAGDFTNYNDADGNPLANIEITSLETAGALKCSGVDVVVSTICAVANLTFDPAADANGSPYATFGFKVNDGTVSSSASYTMTINVTALNDAPTATNLSAAETYTEDTALNLTDILTSDVDSSSLTATLTLSNTAAGSLNTGTSGAVTSTYNAGTGVWTASGTIADVNVLLAGLTFTPAANFNSNFTIATSVTDGVAPAITGTKNMTGTAVNDAPTATNLNAAETYIEDTALNLTDILISDVDSNVTATLTLSNTAAGSLNIGTSGAVTSTYNAGTGVWTASGAVANVNTLLSGLTFTPAANFNSNFTIATNVTDGVAPAITGTKNMTGTAVNDAPVNTVPGAQTINEDATLTFTGGTAISTSDVDASSVQVQLTATNGTLTLAGTTGLSFTVGDGTSDTAMTFTGTITNINTALIGAVFIPTSNFNGPASVLIVTDDQGNTGSGGALSDTDSITINVTAINDAPTGGNETVSTNEDTQKVFAAGDFTNYNDTDGNPLASIEITSLETAGALKCSGVDVVVSTICAVANLTFDPAADANGSPYATFGFKVNDGTASSSASYTMTINVTALNDAPVQSVAPDQFRIDGTTTIAQGGTTNETSVVFKATATDTEGDQYKLEVEVKDNAAAFDGTGICSSALANSGAQASTGSCGSFAAGSYKWRYRFVDSGSSPSVWTVFGGSDPDFIVDTGGPVVTNVTSSTANGTYFAGATIDVTVTFNENVTVTGTPQITLELGAVDGVASYTSGSGTPNLSFTYTVLVGDVTPDLDYVATNSLALNGGTIQDAALNNASLTLPSVGGAGSLAANKAIVIDAALLQVTTGGINSTPDTGDGNISENEAIPTSLGAITQLFVQFNKNVNDPPGNSDTDDVTNPANYRLLYSATGTFATSGCGDPQGNPIPIALPDVQYYISTVTYSNVSGSGPFIATLNLTTPLTVPGFYRLYVCGTTSIVQGNNIALALAGNGSTGSDFTRNFQIATLATAGGGGGGNRNATTTLNVAALPATGFAPNRVTILPEQPEELAYADLGDLWIEIPALGVKSSIVGVPMLEEGEWDVTWLGNSVGWLDGTAFPSWEGNSVLTAHVTNASGLDGPFADLKKLKYGDQIIVHAFGQEYIFEVRNSRITKPFSTSFAFEHLEDESYLTLITCQVYLPKSDTYLYRRVIRAVLVKVQDE